MRNHAQAALEARERHAELGVQMHRAVDVRAPAQNPAVQRETRTVDSGRLV
jgi:hypothetical protein